MSHSTSMPSAAKKPSCSATKSLMPMPLGATRTFLMVPPRYSIVATIHDDAPPECTDLEGGIGALRAAEHREGGGHPARRHAAFRREGARRAHRRHRRRGRR